MTAVTSLHLAGSVLCAGGLAGLLAAPRRLPVGMALGATLTGWLALIAALAPSGTRVPIVAVVALGAVALLRAGAVVARHPHLWFAAIGATLAIRVPVAVGGQEASLLVPLYLTILLGIGMRARSAIGAPPRFPRAVGRPLAALTAWLVLSSAWSSDPAQGSIRAACYIVPFALAAWLVVALWPGNDALAWLCGGFGVIAVSAAAVAIGQGLTGRTFGNATLDELHAGGATFRANGFLHDPNMLGRRIVVALIIALAMGYLGGSGARGRWVQASAATVLTLGLCLTVSQSSGLALIVGVVVILGRAVGWRRVVIVGSVVGAVVIAWGLVGTDGAHRALASQERIARASDGRDRLIGGGIEIWREHPVVGSGLGSFTDHYRATLSPQEARRATLLTSHTAPITVLAEGGLIALGLLVWCGGATILLLRRPGWAAWARWTVLAVLAAIGTHSLLYAALLEDPTTWIALAAGAALTWQPSPQRATTAIAPRRRRELASS